MARCWLYQRDLSALLDGALDDARRTRVQAHADGCSECARRLSALGQVDAWMQRYGDVDARPGFESRFWARARSEEAVEVRPSRGWLTMPLQAAAGLAVALALGFGAGVWLESGTTDEATSTTASGAGMEAWLLAGLEDDLGQLWPVGDE